MKLIKTIIYKFKSLPKVIKGIIAITLAPVILFIGIFVYAISTVMIDFALGTDLSKTVNNEEYQKKQEQLKIEKDKQGELEKENKEKEDQYKKEDSKKSQNKKNEGTKDSTKEAFNTQKKEDSKKEDKISYDKLQQLYLDIESEMSYEEVLSKVQESGLPFSETKFNGSKAIKAAFEEGVTPQRHADEGDNINISFDDDRDGNYVFGTIEYFNHEKFIKVFEYKNGTYWDFRDGKDNGYYINNYQNIMGDKSEKYIKANSKEEQLQYVINYIKDK